MALHKEREAGADRQAAKRGVRAAHPAPIPAGAHASAKAPPGPAFPRDVTVPLRFNAAVFTPPTLAPPPQPVSTPKQASAKQPGKATQRRQPAKLQSPKPGHDGAPMSASKTPTSKTPDSKSPTARPPRAKTPAPKIPAAKPPVVAPSAVPLPMQREPLVTGAAEAAAAADAVFSRSAAPAPGNMAPLPRNRSVTAPPVGLWAAIDAWLTSARKLLRAGFVVKKPGPAPRHQAIPPMPRPMPRGQKQWFRAKSAPMPSLREQTELTQLRAENRRLRNQLEAMIAQQRTREQEPVDG